MGWLGIVTSLVRLLVYLIDYLRDKKKMDDAHAVLLSAALRKSLNDVDEINKIRADTVRKFDDAGGVPDQSDPYLRK